MAIVKLLLANLAPLEKRLACSVEGAVEHGEEDDGLFAEHSPPLVVEPAEDVDILQDLVGVDGRRHDGRYEEMGGGDSSDARWFLYSNGRYSDQCW